MRTLEGQIAELANTVSMQADAIAENRVRGPRYSAVRLLQSNVEMLLTLIPDDRGPQGPHPPGSEG